MDETVNPSLMQTRVDQLTVGDALKLNLAIFAVMGGIGVVVIGGFAVTEKVRTWKLSRKAKKALHLVEEK